MSDYHRQSSVEVMKMLDVTTQGLSDYDVQKRQDYMVLMNCRKEKGQVHSPSSLDSSKIY